MVRVNVRDEYGPNVEKDIFELLVSIVIDELYVGTLAAIHHNIEVGKPLNHNT